MDFSGRSVSLSSDGSRVAIGATANDGGGADAGQVRVYDLSAGAWVQVGSDIDGEAAFDVSGNSVSLSSDGSRVGIGAPYNVGGGSNPGHVRVYELPSGATSSGGSSGGSGSGMTSEELAETGGVDSSEIAFGGALALAAGVGIYALRRRGARA
jgi:LPXTG-motif cell wall-anchored protein